MKKYGFTVCAGLLVVLLVGLVPVFSQDDAEGEEDLQEAWARLSQPGPEHEWLARGVGEWNVTQRIFMEGADEPFEVQGEATFTMKWDRYLHEELRMGGVDEANAVSYIGFDNSAQEFKAINLGIWGTGMDVISGTRSDDGKVVTMTHEGVEKGLGNLKVAHRFVITHRSDDERLVEMFSKYGDAPERKAAEMVYTRK
jgi:hypothetical protein